MTWYPPDGLPPGQFITPDPRFSDGAPGTEHALWMTDNPVPDAGALWGELLQKHEDSGLWPLLLLTLRPHRIVSAPRRQGRMMYYRLEDAHVRMLLDLALTHSQHTQALHPEREER